MGRGRPWVAYLPYREGVARPKDRLATRAGDHHGGVRAGLEARRALQAGEKRAHDAAWGASSPEHDDLIFTNEQGGPMHPRNFDRTWYALQDAAQVRRIRFHDLRHMHVSLLHKAGIELRAIADRVGHSDPSFTLKRYAHVLDDRRRAAAILLSQLLAPRELKTP